jgi:hypothetical protein
MGDRSKFPHFGQTSPTRMTCCSDNARDTDYGLTNTLHPNKRHPNIGIDSLNSEKIANRSKWPRGHHIWDIRRPRGALTPASCTVPSSDNTNCTYSTDWVLQYNIYSIQKLTSPQNRRSMRNTALWPSLADTNDMRIANSRPHHLRTSAQFGFEQTRSEVSYQCYESRKNNKGIKMTLWPTKTRYKEQLSAPTLTRAALNLPQTIY